MSRKSQRTQNSNAARVAISRPGPESLQSAVDTSGSDFLTILEFMPVMLDAFDQDGRIVMWNQECERVTGYTKEEIIGNPQAMELLYPDTDYRKAMLAEWGSRLDNYRGWEWILTCKNGAQKTISWHNISTNLPLQDWASWGIGIDVSRIHRSHKAILNVAEGVSASTGENFFRSLTRYLSESLDCNIAFVGELHPSQTHVIRSVACFQDGEFTPYFDYNLKGTPCEQVIKKESCSFPEAVWKKFPEDEMLQELKAEAYVGSPLVGSDGQSQGIIVVMYNNPIEDAAFAESILRIFAARAAAELERIRAEENLRRTEQQNKLLLEHSPDTILRVARDGTIIHINHPRNTFGEREAVGANLFNLIPSPERKKFESALQEVFEQAKMQSFEHQDPQEQFYRTRFVPITEEKGVASVLIIKTDITEERNRTQEKFELERQLLQAQKMEALGVLAGGVAHDFNNILTFILGFAQLSLREVPENSKQARHLSQIVLGTERAKNLIQQILTFTRKKEPRQGLIPLTKVLKEAHSFLDATLPSSIEIKMTVEVDGATVMGDPDQIHQVIVNLCTNAAHAMLPTGGELELRLDSTQPSARLRERLAAPASSYIRFIVRDRGHGMTPAVMERIFDPFFTTKKVGEGTGLGLSVAHGIVSSHGGIIDVTSTPQKGTCFSVYLPEAKGEYIEKPRQRSALELQPGTILFVDDEELLASLGKEILTELGCSVTSFHSSLEALKHLQEQSHVYDLVITDQTMPGMNGTQLAQQIEKIQPSLPVVITSGFGSPQYTEGAAPANIVAHLSKPYTIEEMASVIGDVLKERLSRRKQEL